MTKTQEKLIDRAVDAINETIGKSVMVDQVDEYVQYEVFAHIVDIIGYLAESKRDNDAVRTAKILQDALNQNGIKGLPFIDEEI